MCNDWCRLNTQALDALDHGEIALAEKAFLSACESQDFRAYNNLGWFYYVQGTDGAVKDSVAEALSQLQRAIAHTRHTINTANKMNNQINSVSPKCWSVFKELALGTLSYGWNQMSNEILYWTGN